MPALTIRHRPTGLQPAGVLMRLLPPADRLQPAESFLDPLADALIEGVTGVPRSASVDRRRPSVCVPRDVLRGVHRPQLIDEILSVVSLVGAEGDRREARSCASCNPLGTPVGLGYAGIDDETVAVLHQRVPREAQLGLLARPLAIEPRLGMGGRGVRVV
jgi:hypothetical protein